MFKAMQFTAHQINTWFSFSKVIHKLCLSTIFYPYPQFLLSLGYTAEAIKEWGREHNRVNTGCISDLINAYNMVAVKYLLCSLVKFKNVYAKIGQNLAIRKII
jgi:hypothetical protein